jgi:hypothetical protein
MRLVSVLVNVKAVQHRTPSQTATPLDSAIYEMSCSSRNGHKQTRGQGKRKTGCLSKILTGVFLPITVVAKALCSRAPGEWEMGCSSIRHSPTFSLLPHSLQ